MKAIYFLALNTILFSSAVASAWVLPDGTLSGEDWDSAVFKNKVNVIFYVSPSKKSLNEEASDTIKSESFDSKYFASAGIIDLKSSWIPNRLLLGAIKKKQKKYPRTIYLQDKNKYFQKLFSYKSKGNDIFVFDHQGNLIFKHLGKLDKADIERLSVTLKSAVAAAQESRP